MSDYSTNQTNNISVRPKQTETTRNDRIRSQYAELHPVTGKRIYSMRKLGRIYHLSPSRIWEIINPEEAKA